MNQLQRLKVNTLEEVLVELNEISKAETRIVELISNNAVDNFFDLWQTLYYELGVLPRDLMILICKLAITLNKYPVGAQLRTITQVSEHSVPEIYLDSETCEQITIEFCKHFRDPSTGSGITPRQLEVIKLILQGLSNREIANKLGVGVDVIGSYASFIHKKLRVTNRSEMLPIISSWLADRVTSREVRLFMLSQIASQQDLSEEHCIDNEYPLNVRDKHGESMQITLKEIDILVLSRIVGGDVCNFFELWEELEYKFKLSPLELMTALVNLEAAIRFHPQLGSMPIAKQWYRSEEIIVLLENFIGPNASLANINLDPESSKRLMEEFSSRYIGTISETGITDREIEIIRLISEGKSDKQIAACLKISVSTVKNHLRNISERMNLYRRMEIGTTAMSWLIDRVSISTEDYVES